MANNKENIKLFAPQRLTDEDEDDGGGRATRNVVADGQVNGCHQLLKGKGKS